MNRATPIALLAIVVSGCAHGSYSMLSDKRPPARPADCALQIFTNESEIERPFRKICLINSTSGAMATTNEALRSARKQACECGAEALLIEDLTSTGSRVSGKSVSATTYGIIYTDVASQDGREGFPPH